MEDQRVRLDADEQNRHFREAKNSRGEDEAQDDDSGDGSVDEDIIELELTHLRIDDIPSLHLERFKNLQVRCSCHCFNDNRHIKNVAHLVNLPDLYFVSNKITVIENLSTLVNITNLELGSNRIIVIENLDCLITKLELKILIEGLEDLENLEEIYLSHNGISRIEGLERNAKLTILFDISNNKISKLEDLGHLKNLEELWASNNMLDSFEDFEAELKDNCLDLATVYAEGNPL
ncbi:MAG: hypothetical protein J3Q66DRAFT_382374 [Benniella sp.]|nr:MAG: hypothetical protein J3Q66DRAFT_382374 [Benniella sp.]